MSETTSNVQQIVANAMGRIRYAIGTFHETELLEDFELIEAHHAWLRSEIAERDEQLAAVTKERDEIKEKAIEQSECVQRDWASPYEKQGMEGMIARLTARAEAAEREVERLNRLLLDEIACVSEAEDDRIAAEDREQRFRKAIEALRDADHFDHWAVRLSDSELTALNTVFALLAQPGEEAGDEPVK